MLKKNLALSQDQWTAVTAAAFATAYLVYTLVGLGSDYQTARQSRLAEQVSLRHSAICTYLGKLPASGRQSILLAGIIVSGQMTVEIEAVGVDLAQAQAAFYKRCKIL